METSKINLSQEDKIKKFHCVLSLSDEGLELMLQRTRRDNPHASEREIRQILKKEIIARSRKGLPSYLIPIKLKSVPTI